MSLHGLPQLLEHAVGKLGLPRAVDLLRMVSRRNAECVANRIREEALHGHVRQEQIFQSASSFRQNRRRGRLHAALYSGPERRSGRIPAVPYPPLS